MTLRKLFGFGLMLASLLAASQSGCGQDGNRPLEPASLSDTELKTVEIQLQRLGCGGDCPAYSVAVHGDGRVEYNGTKYVKEVAKRDGRIERDKVKAILAEFAKVKFWDLVDYDTGDNCGRVLLDMAGAVTELTVNGVKHRVMHYYGCEKAPRSLFELESTIDQLVNSQQWTGDASKAGPSAQQALD